MKQTVQFDSHASICRLGLATRTGSALHTTDILRAIERGINYLNWCGQPDGLSRAVRELGPRRESVFVAVQLESVTGTEATSELAGLLAQLDTDYVDVVTYYYVERMGEWETIIGPGGAHESLLRARAAGKVRWIGLTTHQRPLAAAVAQSGKLDMLMIRYNAAHRGAEQDVFPVTHRLGMPVVTYTGVRWGALMRPTPDDPDGFVPPTASDCYRFVLSCPSVAVCLMAPHNRRELDANLQMLDRHEPLSADEYRAIAAHGDRVRRHAGSFP